MRLAIGVFAEKLLTIGEAVLDYKEHTVEIDIRPARRTAGAYITKIRMLDHPGWSAPAVRTLPINELTSSGCSCFVFVRGLLEGNFIESAVARAPDEYRLVQAHFETVEDRLSRSHEMMPIFYAGVFDRLVRRLQRVWPKVALSYFPQQTWANGDKYRVMLNILAASPEQSIDIDVRTLMWLDKRELLEQPLGLFLPNEPLHTVTADRVRGVLLTERGSSTPVACRASLVLTQAKWYVETRMCLLDWAVLTKENHP